MADAFYLQTTGYSVLSSSFTFRVISLSESSKAHSHSLYNSPRHLLTQRATGWRRFELLRGKRTIASISFNIQGVNACSPLRAPFGGFEIYGTVNPTTIQVWWQQGIVQELLGRGVERVEIKSPPKTLDPTLFSVVADLMQDQNVVAEDEVASILRVDRQRFSEKIVVAKRQRLEKNRASFTFKKIPVSQVDAVYRFLATCQQERGRLLSLTLQQVRALAENFPRHVLLFGVQIENEWAAQALVVRESKEIWYTFYYGHQQKFNKQSPIVFLIEQIYELAQNKGVRWMNLGTSMIDGNINRPLLHFKKSIGAETTIKRTYRLQL